MKQLTLLCLVLLATCAPAKQADPLIPVNSVLRELHVPALTAGQISRDSAWRVLIEQNGTSSRLIMMQEVAALVIPDGPLELLAPLTYFRFEANAWQQHHEATSSVALSATSVTALQRDFVDTTRVYFYRIESLDLSSSNLDSAGSAELVRRTANKLMSDAARLRRTGFLSMDSEP